MAQNFLYSFEFVVGDILVTRPNRCAPEEYPTCCELSFRTSVFVSICDREYGDCLGVDMCGPKAGKGILFSLESPIQEKDRLLIHVYKKKDDSCKFLLGAADLPIKALFDKVTHKFNMRNPKWMETVTRHQTYMPDPQLALKKKGIPILPPEFCYEEFEGRKEKYCTAIQVLKGLLPLFNMASMQTGNIMLTVRLLCHGPSIVTSINVCPTNHCLTRPKRTCFRTEDVCDICHKDPCKKTPKRPLECRRYFGCSYDPCPCVKCRDY